MVALVDQAEEGGQVVEVTGGGGRKGVVAGLALGHIVAYALAQAIVVVGGVVDGQKAAVFGVQNEEQAVEKDEGGFLNLGHGSVGGVGQGLEEPGKNAVEHDTREALGDALFVTLALVERRFDEGGGSAGAAHEC